MSNHDQPLFFDNSDLDCLVGALRADPAVRDAAATVAGEVPFAPAAWVVPADEPEISMSPEPDSVVGAWRSVFDDCYESADCGADSLLTAGWTDSFTGAPLPAEEMSEWVDTTIARIAELNPSNVLEIGAGTGLLMRPLIQRLAPDEYVATDFSAESVRILASLVERLRADGTTTSMAVYEAPATAPVPPSGSGGYDVVVLNSVVQYLPSTMYLEAVLRTVLPAMPPGGHIFLGDLRNELLRGAFTCLRHRRRSPAGTPQGRIAELVARDLDLDGELSLSPWYLHRLADRLPRIDAVETAPRRGAAANEMTLFRYDAVLHVDCAAPVVEPGWDDGGALTVDAVGRRLSDATEPFGFRAIGNARLTGAHRSARDFGRSAAEVPGSGGLDPEELCRLIERCGWTARLRWTPGATAGEFDVWCSPPGAKRGHYGVAVPWRWCGGPVAQRAFPPRIERARKEDLLARLTGRLPPRLLPRDLVFVSELRGNAEPVITSGRLIRGGCP